MQVMTTSEAFKSQNLKPVPVGSIPVHVEIDGTQESAAHGNSTAALTHLTNLNETELTKVLKAIKKYGGLSNNILKVSKDTGGPSGTKLQGIIDGTSVLLNVTDLALSSTELINTFQDENSSLVDKGKSIVAVTIKGAGLVQAINKVCPGLPVLNSAGQVLDHLTLFLNVADAALNAEEMSKPHQ